MKFSLINTAVLFVSLSCLATPANAQYLPSYTATNLALFNLSQKFDLDV